MSAGLTVIPWPPEDRPFCVRVSWLADNPVAARLLQYRDCAPTAGPVWRTATEAVNDIDPDWCVEVRLTEGAS